MGAFDDIKVDLFTPYRATIHVPGRLYGGIPGDPKLLESWIKAKVGAGDEEIRRLWIKNLQEQGADITADMTDDAIQAAAEAITGEKKTNVFKRSRQTGELYIEGRQVKAMLKEAVNILFVGQKFGQRDKGHEKGYYQGKSAIAYFAERVFVVEDEIALGLTQPSGVETQIIHAPGRSALSYVEYVEDVRLTFHVEVLGDCITRRTWAEIWEVARHEGLGARRSQGAGQFDEIEEWTQLRPGSVKRGQTVFPLIEAARLVGAR